MKKIYRLRCLCLALAVILLLGVAPTPAQSAGTESAATRTAEVDLLESVGEQIRQYCGSIDRRNADTTAASALAKHGIGAGGADLEVDKNHALTATVYNSELMMEALTQACTSAIEYMYDTGISSVPYLLCGVQWDWDDPDNNNYGVRACTTDSWYVPGVSTDTVALRQYVDFRLSTGAKYYSTVNSYDESLVWMAGQVGAWLSVERTAVTGSEATFQINCTVMDLFDFATASGDGFKDLISEVGQKMFKEFVWESTISFTLTVPYSCDHGTNAYRWSYDASANTMTSHSGSGYTANAAESITFQSTTGEIRNYYDLADGVMLRHDRSWVLEMDAKEGKQIFLTPAVYQASQTQPSLYLVAGNYLHFYKAYYTEKDSYFKEYCGVSLNGLYAYSSATTYTYRLENQVNADGSNMVYLTVLDKATGAVVLEKTAMDDFYTEAAGEQKTLVSADSDWISGQDFCIRYFGNSSLGFKAQEFELRVWEHGKDAEPVDFYSSGAVTAPTCTQQGYTTYTCSNCGHNKYDSYTDPVGHSYGDWYAETPASCLETGIDRRDCLRCGSAHETRESAATGHIWDEGQVQIEPTDTTTGEMRYTCLGCGRIKTATIPSLSHVHHYTAEVTPPTCTEAGYTTYTCECGSYVGDAVPATGHSYYALSTTSPTCTQGGYTEYLCTVCGKETTGSYVNAYGHEWDAGVVTKEPTLEEEGTMRKTCQVCGATKTVVIPDLSHVHSYYPSEIAPTCTQHGCTRYTCTCGDSYEEDIVDALGHHYDGEHICTVCGTLDPDYVPQEAPAPEPPTEPTQPQEDPGLSEEDRELITMMIIMGVMLCVAIGATVLTMCLLKKKRY